MSWSRWLGPAVLAALGTVALEASWRTSADARDELAALRAELADRPAPSCPPMPPTAVERAITAPAPAAPPADDHAAPAAARAEPAESPEQAAAIDQAHEVVAAAIRAGHLTPADGAALRRLHAAAGSSPEFAEIAREIAAAVNRGELHPDGDPMRLMP
jgi:hypothetical protein